MTLLLIVLLIVGGLVGFAILLYNSLIKLKNKVEEAWADIDTQLKRRYDLLPNLVETVKGYASHEAETLEKVIQARNMAMGAKSMQEHEEAENMITGALKTIFALTENYPDLKANQNFMDLQKTLKEIEEHIQLARRYYNGTVRDFNTKIEVFPNNLIAGMLHFTKRDFFQADDSEKENVKVSFSKEDSPAPAATAAPEDPAPTPEPATQEPAPEPEKPAETPAPEASPEATPEPAPAPETPAAEPEKPAEEPPAQQ